MRILEALPGPTTSPHPPPPRRVPKLVPLNLKAALGISLQPEIGSWWVRMQPPSPLGGVSFWGSCSVSWSTQSQGAPVVLRGHCGNIPVTCCLLSLSPFFRSIYWCLRTLYPVHYSHPSIYMGGQFQDPLPQTLKSL